MTNMISNPTLAIVIPAFKIDFLAHTLDSLAAQSNKNFKLYIGDDASSCNLKEIIESYLDKIQIVYHRFKTNMGSYSLVKQWERCLELTENEDYIWLFSDDDLLPPDAVERFFSTQRIFSTYDVYRFNLQFIDEKGTIVREATNHPEIEKSIDFIKRRLTFSTLSAASEYIFSRDTYDRNKGFVEFPMAWCSDDASWELFANESGIFTINGNPVQMRMSGLNISSDNTHNFLKFKAVLLYGKWINENFKNEIHSVYHYRYICSQIISLKINVIQRINLLKSYMVLLNPIFTIALFIHISRIYKIVDKLFGIKRLY